MICYSLSFLLNNIYMYTSIQASFDSCFFIYASPPTQTDVALNDPDYHHNKSTHDDTAELLR